MRASDIHVGNRYMCRISGELREVIVTQRFANPRGAGECFRVRRADMPLSGVQLKPRRATALQPLPGSPEEKSEIARLAKAAAKPKPPREPKPPHAAQSFRSYVSELRAFERDVRAWSERKGKPFADRRVVQRWLRHKLRLHLDNRMTWLSFTVMPSHATARDLRRAAIAYEKNAVTREDVQLAAMLRADPEVVAGLRSLVRA